MSQSRQLATIWLCQVVASHRDDDMQMTYCWCGLMQTQMANAATLVHVVTMDMDMDRDRAMAVRPACTLSTVHRKGGINSDTYHMKSALCHSSLRVTAVLTSILERVCQ